MRDMAEPPARKRRPKAETKQFIERAADISGVTLSDFVISKAYEAAREIIREHDIWVLNRQDSKAFGDSMLDLPEPIDTLKAAASRYKARVRNAAA
jgi:uncharacterized protein (DUF1778 family)